MATVLEKPILLDETGQDIVSKLEEIKSAITTSGDFTPVQIKITTPPAKRTYASGEELDLTGMVVTLIASNGITYDVTASCTTNPVEGTAITGDTDVVVSFYWGRDDVTFTTVFKVYIRVLESIAITTPPAYTDFYIGQVLELDGIVITATYRGGITEDVTNSCTFNPELGTRLTVDDTEVVISYTEGSITKTVTQEIEIVPVYGVEWDGTASSSWTRTDGAAEFEDPNPYYSGKIGANYSPFDDIAPWSEITVGTDSQAGAVVSIPRFYYKWSRNGKKMKLQISNKPLNGFHTSPAHMNRGDGKGEKYIEPYGERQYVTVGRYLCSNNTYNSVSGNYPYSNVPIGTMRDNIHSLGNNIWLWDFATYWTICMLYLVEYADWDVGKTIGVGGGSQIQAKTGQTDSLLYHTGTTASSRSEAGYVRYRYIEDLWSNYYAFCDGIYFKNEEMFCTKNPAFFGDYDAGTLVGTRITGEDHGTYGDTYSACISEWSNSTIEGFEYALFPSNGVEDNTFSSYVCDEVNGGYEALNVLYLGSMGNTGGVVRPRDGLFHLDSHYNTTDTYTSVSSRLMVLY